MGLDGSGPDVRTWSLTCVFSRMADFPSSSSLVIYSKVYATPATVYILGLAKSLASYTLHVTSLDAASGELIRSGDYPSSITTGLSQVFFLADVRTPETQPRVVWLEDGAINDPGICEAVAGPCELGQSWRVLPYVHVDLPSFEGVALRRWA